MNIIFQILFNCIGFVVCLLGICGLQWALFQLLEYLIPYPFKQAESQKSLTIGFYKGTNHETEDKNLNPLRQTEEENQCDDADYYDCAPTGLFSSTWTHFILLVENIAGVIVKQLTTICKQNH